jgi:hypothetical protein
MNKIKITLKSHKSNQGPWTKISINNQEYFNQQINEELIEIEVDCQNLHEQNMLIVEHYNKTNRDTLVDSQGNIIADKALELIDLHINGLQVPRNILYKKPFYVVWPQNLVDQAAREGRVLPEFIDKNLYFGFNGKYCFNFTNNFKKEYFSYHFQMERDANTDLQTVTDGTAYFEAYGLRLAINQEFNYTISDLKYIIDNEQLPTNN